MPTNSAFNIPHSPIAAMGTITLLVAFVLAAYGASTGIIGNVQKRRKLVNSSIYTLYGLCAIMILASALMIYAFVTHDYSIKYVTMYSDTSMPLYYKVAAYWGGLDGSLMFWVFCLSVFAAIAVWTNHKRHRDMIGYVVGVIMVVQLFFLALLIYSKNPFATWLTEAPTDGKGLNPLLQTYWMSIHPPSLYIGFVAATIPFAFGIAALASGRLDNQWTKSVRVWTFLCWFFLSFGLILGGRWAYEELGWGGYWAWDPVENAGLLPWFTATAFLHSVIIQEQRGMLKVWNMVLVIITFFLTIFGTFMTRSGIVQSVHAFGEDNTLALLFVLFMAFVVITSVGLLIWRLPLMRSVSKFESFLSREFAFLLNNWILLACAFFVLFATMFPTLSEALNGERITVGPPFFNKWMVPFGIILLFLAGATPLLAWRRTTAKRLWGQFAFPVGSMVVVIAGLAIIWPRTRVNTSLFSDSLQLPMALINFGIVAFTLASIGQEFWGGMRVRMRQTGGDPVTSLIGIILAKRRKYGGYIIHLGIAVMFIGFAGKAFDIERNVTLRPGESYKIRNYEVTYERMETDDTNSDHMMRWLSHVRIKRDGEFLTKLAPEIRNYRKSEQPVHEVAVDSSMAEDFYIVFNSFQEEDQLGSFTIFINPLINWVWLGFFFLTIGTFFCLIRDKWVQNLSPRRRTRAGRAAEVAVVLLAVGATTFGAVEAARAQAPVEHDSAASHSAGGNAKSQNREDNPLVLAPYKERAVAEVRQENPSLDPASTDFQYKVQAKLEPIVNFNRKVFNELVCLCGGCAREALGACKCGFAANERGFILNILSRHDLWTAAGRAEARRDVHESMVAKHTSEKEGSGQRVLMVPPDKGFNRLAWAIPYLALAGALALLYGVSRRWVRKGREDLNQTPDVDMDEDEAYSDILDDELRETD